MSLNYINLPQRELVGVQIVFQVHIDLVAWRLLTIKINPKKEKFYCPYQLSLLMYKDVYGVLQGVC